MARPRVTSEVRVGERAPDFELEDTGGSHVKLSAMRGQWVALCFVGRREGVTALQRVQTDLAPRGVRVVAVCSEKAHSLKRFVNEHPTSVLALADPMSDVACLYGLYDTTRDRSLPGLVLLDIEGRVRLAIMGQALPEEDVARIVQYAVAGF